ncbi:hypothetical protein R3W88_033103 [Solanum pinnatisectum]|uniref:Uncharacterized protein n=1 Tax=Solanum pinnatisectum TaxID=50273 RepID=A0AAV9K3W0_9SOLN|nr:hypothetical protein R3W88_033103 [Solanum pinnatisectum]
MCNSSSPSRLPLSQEIENPSSFNFSIPPPEGYPSTLVCAVGETEKSITPHAEVLVKEKKKEGKGKMVESSNKGDKRRYATRGTVQKLIGDAMVANEAQNATTLLECECTERKVKAKSHVSDLLEQQESIRRELNDLITISQGPGTSVADKEEVKRLRAENAQLLKTNATLNEEVQALNKQIIQAHVDTNNRMNLLLQSFSPHPPLS